MTESSAPARPHGEDLISVPLVTIGGKEILLAAKDIRTTVSKSSGSKNAQVAVDPTVVVAGVPAVAEHYRRKGYGFLTQRPTHYIIGMLLLLSSLAASGIWLGMRLRGNAAFDCE